MGRTITRSGEAEQGLGRALALVFAILALILQANAPVQATLMAAGSDLPGDLCALHTPANEQRTPTEREKACAACAVCVAAASAAIIVEAAFVPVPAGVVFARTLPLAHTPARAPPARTANARAPPPKA